MFDLVEAVQQRSPDWLFIQFNQFSYGQWGLNPFFPLAVRRIRKACSDTRIAVMFHEDFVPVTNWRRAIMTTWQRWQFWMLGQQADQIFFSIDPWVRRYASWFPQTPVHHLPVGSNMPRVEADRSAVRRELGVSDDSFVVGVFGSLHASRLLDHIRAAAKGILQQSANASLLYIGPHGEAFQDAMNGLPVLDAGRLPPEAVSRHFQAMDIYLAPFVDGVSTRRGSFMTGLQHGVPTVATVGPLTDNLLRKADGEAFHLAPVNRPDQFAERALYLQSDVQHRTSIGTAGRQLYDNYFTFEVAADTLLHHLSSSAEIPA